VLSSSNKLRQAGDHSLPPAICRAVLHRLLMQLEC